MAPAQVVDKQTPQPLSAVCLTDAGSLALPFDDEARRSTATSSPTRLLASAGNVPGGVALLASAAPRLPGRLDGDQSQEEQGERRPGHRQLDPVDREVALPSRLPVRR